MRQRFVGDVPRVARKLFITVPNRFSPVEHHTTIPPLHWKVPAAQLRVGHWASVGALTQKI
jgi:hypothetical protein